MTITTHDIAFQNAGAATLAAGIATFGQVFQRGEIPSGASLVAKDGATSVPIQMDVKTRYEDGSVKMAVLAVQRPALAAGETFDLVLSKGPAAAAPAALDLAKGLAGHSFVVQAGATKIDVISALNAALKDGSASFWQKGALATEARVEIDLPGSQRMLFDVTVFKGGGFSVEAQFNNDGAMGATGGRVSTPLTVTMDGKVLTSTTLNQAQYQNWHESYSNGVDGGQGTGKPSAGWLNIVHDIAHLQDAGAVANYDLGLKISENVLSSYANSMAGANWDAPLAGNNVTKYMPMTGGRDDIGITTEPNTAWLISQDARAAGYALGQAEAASSIPWHFWDTANDTWLNTDNYPKLWVDGRGGRGTPGDANSGGLTQQQSGDTGWTLDISHQPNLSYVPYIMTGERWMLDNLQAQAAWNVMNIWPAMRNNGSDLLVQENQVRGAAWALREVDQAALTSPDGSKEKAFFQSVSDANYKWMVSKIPEWTAAQGEAHGWIPGIYGYAGVLPPWQQDYFASTVIAAARNGNADARTLLDWQSNFLVGRFHAEDEGFQMRDGAAYLIAISDKSTGRIYKTWEEIGAKTVSNNLSNGDTTWSKTQGDYGQLALATLSGIYELTGNPAAKSAYEALIKEAPPLTSAATFAKDPTYALAAPGTSSTQQVPVLQPPVTPPPVVTTPTKEMSAGTGPDTLVIKVSEQAYQGDAQFTVKVNGVQLGGVFTSTANHAQGQFDTLTLKGAWGTAALKVEVNFTNDLWHGTAATDRNLYLDGMTYNGKAVPASSVELQGGLNSVAVPANLAPVVPEPVLPPVLPPPILSPIGNDVTVGTGPDTLVIKVSEQAYQGDAQFTVKVDGVQVGGTFTAKASNALGQFDTLTLKGAWGPGAHKVEVNFTNDLWGGTATADRNLYVKGMTYNGVAVPSSSADLLSNGAVTIGVPVTASAVTTIGTGLNTLELKVAAQNYQGDPQFTVKVDGIQIGGTYTAKANFKAGQSETLALKGAWGSAAHTVEVNFINDLWGGTATADRNLYVLGITYDGKAVPNSTKAMESAGAVKFAVPLSVVTGDGGPNIVVGSALADSLMGMGGNDTLQGGAGNDTLDGGDGNDLLNGGTGADRMIGGSGDDTFLVDNLGDVVVELANGGYDKVVSSVSYVLGANVERLELTGSAANGTGNELGNEIVGNALANLLSGLAGNDKLSGGGGNDTLLGGMGADILEGGSGADSFRYGRAAEGGDTILDFVTGSDFIEVSASGFGGGLTVGSGLLSASRFASNTTGLANSQAGTGQFIYETDAAKLWWDADGSGGAAAVTIATFTPGTSFGIGDIHLFG